MYLVSSCSSSTSRDIILFMASGCSWVSWWETMLVMTSRYTSAKSSLATFGKMSSRIFSVASMGMPNCTHP